MKKQFLILFAFISVLAFGQAPQRFNKVIVTGDITSPKFIKTGSNADSVLLGNGLARAISTIKTDTVSLSNRINAKATGSGTANGNNTGDETLSSIKTKLGAATPVSDGYLKYQDWNIFNSKEPAITKNTAFNKNFGTTTGTVLEGRTFGTAANSAVGDFIQNQNNSAQSANMWISGIIKSSSNKPLIQFNNTSWGNSSYIQSGVSFNASSLGDYLNIFNPAGKGFSITRDGVADFYITPLGTAVFSSPVHSTGFILNGNNLTSSLTTNYIPKWNGSSFVNATAGTDYQLPITLTTNGTSGAATFSGNVLNVPNYASNSGIVQDQTTVNGSTSGNIICSMPFQTNTYKKVIIRINNLTGNATYTFPNTMNYAPSVYTGASGISPITYSVTTTGITLTGGSSSYGWVIIEGY